MEYIDFCRNNTDVYHTSSRTKETKSVEETKPTEKETAAAVEPSSKDETKEEIKAKETEKMEPNLLKILDR